MLDEFHIYDMMLPLLTASTIALLVVWLLHQVERSQRKGDDTALNGIGLLCQHTEHHNLNYTISSSEGG